MEVWKCNTLTEGVWRHSCRICGCVFYSTSSRDRACCDEHNREWAKRKKREWEAKHPRNRRKDKSNG